MKAKHIITLSLCVGVTIASLLFFLGSTEEVLTFKEPSLTITPFTPEGVSAKAYEVLVLETGTVLASNQENEVLPIASVTKLLTAAVILDTDVAERQTTVTASDVATEGRAGKLSIGDTYTEHELLFPLLLESSNDAGETLLRMHPTLLKDMNAFVRTLGLQHIVFKDVTGLSSGNTGTAHELAVLLQKLYDTKRHLFDITTLKESMGEHTGWYNNNPYVKEEGYRGGKHGFTEASGKTAVAVFEETLPNGESVAVGYVLLKSTDLEQDMKLLREGVSKNIRIE